MCACVSACLWVCVCVCVCVLVCVRVCASACVRALVCDVRAWVRVCVCECVWYNTEHKFYSKLQRDVTLIIQISMDARLKCVFR